jgi:hypothetical protein
MPGQIEIDLPSGRVSIVVAKPGPEPAAGNPWDEVLRNNAPNEERPS